MIEKTTYGKKLKMEAGGYSHIPYTYHVNNSTLKTKNGDLISVIKLSGVSHETSDTEQLNIWKKSRNNLWRSIANNKVSIFSHLIRNKQNIYPSAKFDSDFSTELDCKYNNIIQDDDLYVNDLYITVIRKKTNDKIEKFGDFIKDIFSKGNAKEEKRSELSKLKEHQDVVNKVMNGLSSYTPKLLSNYYKEDKEGNKYSYSQTLEFISYLLNREWREVPVTFLDASKSLLMNKIKFHKEYFEIKGETRKVGSIISVKEYASLTAAGMLDGMLKIPVEFILTQSFDYINKSQANTLITTQRNRLVSSGDLGETQIEELDEALDQLVSNDFCMGYHHLTISVVEPNLNSLNKSINLCINELNDLSLFAVREYLGMEACYWAQFPANNSYITRKAPITSKNFAAFTSLHNFPIGSLNDNYWGDCVVLLKTTSQTPYYFNFHYPDDLGNTTLIGPSGVGKTVLIGFLSSFVDKFHAKQIFFDKDRGSEIYIRTQKGVYKTIENGVRTGFNPFHLEPTDNNKAFIFELLKVIMGGEKAFKSSDLEQINLAIDGIFKLDFDHRNLTNFYEFIQFDHEDGIKDRLNNWIRDGAYAWVFDNEQDTLDLSNNYIGFDLTDLLDNPSIRTTILMYLFHCVDSLPKGERTVKWLDEGWKMLDDPYFEMKLKNDFKVIRKKNGFNVFGTQEPEDVLATRVGGTIMSQSPTQIFLPNPSAKEKDYVDGFNLTKREYQLIKDLDTTSRCFLLKQGNKSVIVSLDLGSLKNEIAILSTTSKNQELLTQIRGEVGEDPKDFLPIFHARRN